MSTIAKKTQSTNGHQSNGLQKSTNGNGPTAPKVAKMSTNGTHANGKHANGNGNGAHLEHKEQEIVSFLKSVFEMSVREGYERIVSREAPVINFKNPEQLGKEFDFQVEDRPLEHKQLLDVCQKVFDYSVKTGHPHFFNQLYAGMDPYGFAGSVITDVLNHSIYTYEVTPVFVLMEQAVVKQVCDIIGYQNGDGTMTPGGSYSNMLGLNLARYCKFPTIKEVGMRRLPRMVAFTNEQCHYSNKKNASLLGIGTDDLIAVRARKNGQMDVADLIAKVEKCVAEGAVPFCVIATSGTTVLGAYDELNPIADVCEKHDIWLHVDAAWGGGCMFSKKHKHLMEGVERSNSVGWNMHKLPMAPVQCCFFVTSQPEILAGAHSLHVPYLFQLDKTLYDPSYDVGKKVIQCGRKIDIFKFWLMWKALGRDGMEARIDKSFANARYLVELIKQREGFHLLLEPECTNVCFYYVPESMRSLKFDLDDKDFCARIAKVAPKIKERMTVEGRLLCGYQPVGELPNFFRMIVISDDVTRDDMLHVIDTIEKHGRDL